MESLSIRPCTFGEIERMPNIDALIAEYAAESSHSELPGAGAQWTHYKSLEKAGIFTAIGAFQGDELIGFIGVLISQVPHYQQVLAVTESFFVASAHRKTGAGIGLLRAAEAHALDAGANCLLVSAPHGGSLEQVMPRMGYRHSNTVFTRKLRDE